MAKTVLICDGGVIPYDLHKLMLEKSKLTTIDVSLSEVWDHQYGPGSEAHCIRGIKRPKVKCPTCGRKITPSLAATHDGDPYFRIPPHKIKSWWKK